MKRLEEIRSRRSYLAISDDGSGWVPILDASRRSSSGTGAPDLSPPRQVRSHFNTSSSGDEGKPLDPSGEALDLSPPRQRRARYDTPSPEPGPHPTNSVSPDGDLSPPRHSHPKTVSSDAKRDNLGRHDSLNLSPPRRGHRGSLEDPKPSGSISPNRDLSPPRRSRRQTETLDLKSKNSERHGSPGLSPPRKHQRHSAEPNPKASGRRDSPDLSPPRRSRLHKTSSDSIGKNSERPNSLDLSPPRRSRPPTVPLDFKRKNSERPESQDVPPPRWGRHHSPEVDASRASSEVGLSPPRGRKDSSSVKEARRSGLFSKQDFKEETDRKRKELAGFSAIDPSVSGRGAEPVYRDKLSGNRLSKGEFLKLQQGEEKPKEKKLEWGKGLAQKREAEARELELESEKDKPFARTRDDPELDKMLKERVRWGDPMAHLVKRKQPDLLLEDLGDDEKMKESGFLIPQTIPSHSWITRGIDPAANRYGIRPGRHWDGVDRSNGYEKEMFKRQNEKRATEREAYLWSVSDM
ncbi:uncharacterized protein LOC131248130 isoform X2 [Magnolia sinica]|nr:uncharacterized protein LOC131248130 isoform X2 [Magnolia sinica]